MKIKVTVTQQENGGSKATEIVLNEEEFNLKADWYDYVSGEKTGANGNSVNGAMVGPNHYFRFPDIVDIKVEPIEEVVE